MAMNRVQFQPGAFETEFPNRYAGEDKCEATPVAAGRVVRHMRQLLSRSIDNGLIPPLDFLSLHRNNFVMELLPLDGPIL